MEADPEDSQPLPASPAGWQAEDKYHTLFRSIDEGFCVIEVLFDAVGKAVDYVFLEANPSFERQTGMANAVGRRMRALAPAHEEHWFSTYGEIAQSGQPRRFEAPAAALGRWYDVYAFRVGEPGQNLVAVLFNDITARKQSEQVLEQASRHKTEFIAILAHELRNPLAPLRTAIELLERASDRHATFERVHPIMQRQLRHLQGLVDDLLDLNGIARGVITLQRQTCDLREIVQHSLETTEAPVHARGHTVTTRVPDASVILHADPLRLGQVLTNLLQNAAKYTPEGGRIDLSLSVHGAQALIEIADTGVGLPADRIESIFELFTQVTPGHHAGGLGIGLALARQIVSLHGGTLSARSEGPGQGSCFSVCLPLQSS